MKKETKEITKKSLGFINVKLCAAMLLALCMLAGCHHTEQQENTEDYSTIAPEQTETAIETPSIEPTQTEEVTETPNMEVSTEAPTPSVEPVQTKEGATPSKQPVESEKPKDATQAEHTDEPAASDTKVIDKTLGFSIQFSEELYGKIKYTSDLNYQDDDFGMELHYTEFYTKLEEKKQPLFMIYKIEQKMTETEVEDVNPEMGYLGCSGNATYTISYMTEPKSGLSSESEQEFVKMMGEAVGEITKTFQIIE